MGARDELVALVVKNGSYMTQGGFAGDDAPRCVFPSFVRRPAQSRLMVGAAMNDAYIGDGLQIRRRVRERVTCPIERGIVTSWDDMELIWRHTFYDELRVAPEEHPVVLVEPPLNPKSCREHAAQMMFDTFNVPALYLALQQVLSLYCLGCITGVVVDCGHGVSHAVPVFEGYALLHAVSHLDVAGSDLTEYMAKLLAEAGTYSLTTDGDRQIVRDIKEKLCYVALDFDLELQAAARPGDLDLARTYELPDGTIIPVCSERFCCPEALFRPSLVGSTAMGIQDLTFQSVMQCDVDLRQALFGKVVLAGGGTLFAGFGERMSRELAALAPASVQVKVVAPPERKYSAWIGGSLAASLEPFERLWVTRSQYDDAGPAIVHSRCF